MGLRDRFRRPLHFAPCLVADWFEKSDRLRGRVSVELRDALEAGGYDPGAIAENRTLT